MDLERLSLDSPPPSVDTQSPEALSPTTEKELDLLLAECQEAMDRAKTVLKQGEKIPKGADLRSDLQKKASRLNVKILAFVGLGLAGWVQGKTTDAAWAQVKTTLSSTDTSQAIPEQSPREQQKNTARLEMAQDLHLSYNEAIRIQNWVDARLLEKRQQVVIDMMVSGTHIDRSTVADPTIRTEFERRLSQKIFEDTSGASEHIMSPVNESEAEKTVRVTRAIQLYVHRISNLLLQDYTTGRHSDFDRGPERLTSYWGDS